MFVRCSRFTLPSNGYNKVVLRSIRLIQSESKPEGFNAKLMQGLKKRAAKISAAFDPTLNESQASEGKQSSQKQRKNIGSRIVKAANTTESLMIKYLLPLLPEDTPADTLNTETRAERMKKAAELNEILRFEANKINSVVRAGANVHALDILLDTITEEHDIFQPRGSIENRQKLQLIEYQIGAVTTVKPVLK